MYVMCLAISLCLPLYVTEAVVEMVPMFHCILVTTVRENKHCMCGAATCDLNHIMTSCTHFGEIPSKDDIVEMEGRAVRWMSAVADTI